MSLEKYEKLALYVQVFVASIMFSIIYENTTFKFGQVTDIHSKFSEVHICLLVICVFNLIGMQWSKNKSYKLRLDLKKA